MGEQEVVDEAAAEDAVVGGEEAEDEGSRKTNMAVRLENRWTCIKNTSHDSFRPRVDALNVGLSFFHKKPSHYGLLLILRYLADPQGPR